MCVYVLIIFPQEMVRYTSSPVTAAAKSSNSPILKRFTIPRDYVIVIIITPPPHCHLLFRLSGAREVSGFFFFFYCCRYTRCVFVDFFTIIIFKCYSPQLTAAVSHQ